MAKFRDYAKTLNSVAIKYPADPSAAHDGLANDLHAKQVQFAHQGKRYASHNSKPDPKIVNSMLKAVNKTKIGVDADKPKLETLAVAYKGLKSAIADFVKEDERPVGVLLRNLSELQDWTKNDAKRETLVRAMFSSDKLRKHFLAKELGGVAAKEAVEKMIEDARSDDMRATISPLATLSSVRAGSRNDVSRSRGKGKRKLSAKTASTANAKRVRAAAPTPSKRQTTLAESFAFAVHRKENSFIRPGAPNANPQRTTENQISARSPRSDDGREL